MTVEARFPPFLPFHSSFLRSLLPSLPPLLSCSSPVPLPSLLSSSCLSPFPYPFPYALKSSGSRQSLADKRFWYIFSLKSTHLFQFHNDRFVIFTLSFGCAQLRQQIHMGATWGHCPHNFFGRGGDRPNRPHGVGAYQ